MQKLISCWGSIFLTIQPAWPLRWKFYLDLHFGVIIYIQILYIPFSVLFTAIAKSSEKNKELAEKFLIELKELLQKPSVRVSFSCIKTRIQFIHSKRTSTNFLLLFQKFHFRFYLMLILFLHRKSSLYFLLFGLILKF